jgi:hypothetical protein
MNNRPEQCDIVSKPTYINCEAKTILGRLQAITITVMVARRKTNSACTSASATATIPSRSSANGSFRNIAAGVWFPGARITKASAESHAHGHL